jgi:response regulator RpfG family c-di-GMP phosphodiesterase
MTEQDHIDQLERVNNQLKTLKGTLRRNFQDMVNLLTSVISLSSPFLGSHLRRVAETSKELANRILPGDKEQTYAIYYAGLLHDLGLVGFSEEIITSTVENLSPQDQEEFKKHPVRGENIINTVYDLKPIAKLIRHHHEDFDGKGYPDQLSGKNIPLGSRIIRVVTDFDTRLHKTGASMSKALEDLKQWGGIYYDPEVLEPFALLLKTRSPGADEFSLPIRELKEGQFLMDDIYLENGMLLLPRGVFINGAKLNKIQSFASLTPMGKMVRVKQG